MPNTPINYSDSKWKWKDLEGNASQRDAQIRAFNRQRLPVEPLDYDVINAYDLGNSKYDQGMPEWAMSDVNEWRAQQQSGWEQIGSGIAKGAITTGTTFVNTLVGLPLGALEAVSEGDLSKIWDNEVTNLMGSIDDWAEKAIPNYYTNAETESAWYTNVFTANFLGDKLLKNFGFTFGAGAAGKVISKLPKILPKVAMKVAAATGGSAKNAAAIGRVTNTFETGLLSAIGEGSIEALQATKEWSADMTNRINQEQTNKLQLLQQEYQTNINDIVAQYGHEPELASAILEQYQQEVQQQAKNIETETNQKMAQVASQRAQLGNAVLGFNIPILTLSNMALLGRVYAKGWTAEQQSLGKFIGSNMDNLSKAGTTTTKTTRNILGKETTKEVVNNVYKNNLTLTRNILRGGKQALGEGFEELNQAVVSNTAKKYNNDYFAQSVDPNATEETADMWHSLLTEFGNTYSDINSWEEFFIGMLSGGISNIVLGANKGLAQERQQTQELVDMLNQRVNTFDNRNIIQGLNRHGRYGDQMVESALRSDKKDFKDAEFAQTVSDVIMWSEAGKLEDLKQIIDYNLNNNLTDEELEQIAESLSQKDDEGGEHNSLAAGTNEYRRRYIQDQKDKYHKVIDKYSEERDNLVGLVGNRFNREELSELTYLRLRAQDSAERSEELQKQLLTKISDLRNKNLRDKGNVYDDGITATKLRKTLLDRLSSDRDLYDELIKQRDDGKQVSKKQLKSLENKIKKTERFLQSNLEKLTANETKVKYLQQLFNVHINNDVVYESTLDFIEKNINQAISLNADLLAAGNVFEVAQNIQDLVNILSNIQGNDVTVHELETLTQDSIRLVDDANTYNNKLNEYLNKPEKLQQKNQGLVERAKNHKIQKEADNVEEEINNTTNFNDFRVKLENLDPRVKTEVLKRLKNRQNKNALNYEDKTERINYVHSFIKQSDETDRVKQITTALFDTAVATLNDNELFNIDSPFYSRENNTQLDDDIYQSVKILLTQSFNYQQNETAEPDQSDALNIDDKQTTDISDLDDLSDEERTLQELITLENEELDDVLPDENTEFNTDIVEGEGVELDDNLKPITQQPQQTQQTEELQLFKQPEHEIEVTPANLENDNLTSDTSDVDENQITSQQEPEGFSQNRPAMGLQEKNTKRGSDSFGKPAFEENPKVKPLYETLQELRAFKAVDDGVVQQGSKIYFGLMPSLDRRIKAENDFDGVTILLFVDGQCVGHVPNIRQDSYAKKHKIADLLLEEFKEEYNDKNTQGVLISKKYYTVCDEMWTGRVWYQNEYRNMTPDDLNWINRRLNSSVTSVEDKTPLLTIFDGYSDFRKGNVIFNYGIHVSPVYLANNIYKGAPVLLVPSGAYDRNKPNTQQDYKALVPVVLKRIKAQNLNQDSKTFKDINNLVDNVFKGNLSISQLNTLVGNLKSKLTYNFSTLEGKQEVFIVPARISDTTNTIIQMSPKMFERVKTKYEDAKFTHLIIQRKVNDKIVSQYTVGVANGNIYQTAVMPQDMIDNNKKSLLNFLINEADSFVNIEQSRLNDPDYVSQVFEEGLVQTNAKHLKVDSNSFSMVDEVYEDVNKPKEDVVENKPVSTTQQETSNTTESVVDLTQDDMSNSLLDLLGEDFNATNQAETEGEDVLRLSRVTDVAQLGTIDVEKEVNNVMRMLPQLDREHAFRIVDSLIKINDQGDKAQGMFNKGIMTLSRMAETGTGYHEAFHLVFNMLLDNNERTDLFNEYRTQFPNLNQLELEERMADDFKEYSLLREADHSTDTLLGKIGDKIKNFFNKLFEILHLKKRQPLIFNTVCSDIWQGKYGYRQLNETNAKAYSRISSVKWNLDGVALVLDNGDKFFLGDLSKERFQRFVDSQVNKLNYNKNNMSFEMNKRWGLLADKLKRFGIEIKGIKRNDQWKVTSVKADDEVMYYHQLGQRYIEQYKNQNPDDPFGTEKKCY